jgi:hypothetical protein
LISKIKNYFNSWFDKPFEIIPANKPNKVIGWKIKETIGLGIINTRGIRIPEIISDQNHSFEMMPKSIEWLSDKARFKCSKCGIVAMWENGHYNWYPKDSSWENLSCNEYCLKSIL